MQHRWPCSLCAGLTRCSNHGHQRPHGPEAMLHMEKGQEYDFSDGFVVMVLAQSVLQSSVVKMSSLGHLKTCTCLQEAQVQ